MSLNYESLESRRLFSTSIVNGELHRPPRCVADFNRDGFDDVAVMTKHSRGGDGIGIDVWLNDTKGALVLSGHTDCDDGDPDAAVVAADIAAGDVNGDGAPDLVAKLFTVTGDYQPSGKATHAVLHNSGAGEFGGDKPTMHETAHVIQQVPKGKGKANLIPSPEFDHLSVTDMNRDGVGDIISVYGDEISISIMSKEGPRQVSRVVVRGWDPHTVKSIAGRLADMDGDGRPDLVAVVNDGIEYASFVIDPATGEPALGKVSKVEGLTIKQTARVVVGDLDGDGLANDLAVLDGRDSVIVINDRRAGPVRFENIVLKRGISDDILIGDTDGDGADDLFTVLRTAHDTAKNSINNVR